MAQAVTLQTLWSDFADRITYTFFNRTPTAGKPTVEIQTDQGVISGEINADNNNAFALAYDLSEKPKYGEAVVDPETGEFTYTPNVALVKPGITDHFTVTIDNAPPEITGPLGQVQTVLHNLAIALGVSQPDSAEVSVTVTVSGSFVYGGISNEVWWQQQSYDNCTLMATEMAVAQVTGIQESEDFMVGLAKATDSVVYPGYKMYLKEDVDAGANVLDMVALMNSESWGVSAKTYSYGTPGAATAADGQEALSDLEVALAEGKAVMAGVNADAIWTAASASVTSGTPNYTSIDHQLVVIFVDLPMGQVYLNDSGVSYGQGMKVPLGAFLSAWQGRNYQMTVVEASPA
jgi:hypothetical protein